MPVVLDANLVVVLASRDPRADAVERHLQDWLEAGEELSAPALFPHEVASGLVRLSGAGHLPADELDVVCIRARRCKDFGDRPTVQDFAGGFGGVRALKGMLINISTFPNEAKA